MLKMKRRVSVLAFLLVVAWGQPLLAASSGSTEFEIPSSGDIARRTHGCTFQERAALTDYSSRIGQAESVEEARRLAARPTQMARRALGVATWVAPGADSLNSAHARLEQFEGRLAMASTPSDVAGEFDQLIGAADLTHGSSADGSAEDEPMMLADLNIENAEVHGPAGCHYSTGEVVAVVIGFLLFIIPGIILLVVLC